MTPSSPLSPPVQVSVFPDQTLLRTYFLNMTCPSLSPPALSSLRNPDHMSHATSQNPNANLARVSSLAEVCWAHSMQWAGMLYAKIAFTADSTKFSDLFGFFPPLNIK